MLYRHRTDLAEQTAPARCPRSAHGAALTGALTHWFAALGHRARACALGVVNRRLRQAAGQTRARTRRLVADSEQMRREVREFRRS
jgi:hypothetical protein